LRVEGEVVVFSVAIFIEDVMWRVEDWILILLIRVFLLVVFFFYPLVRGGR